MLLLEVGLSTKEIRALIRALSWQRMANARSLVAKGGNVAPI